MLTDEEIQQIARIFIRECGDHFVNERAIPEDDIEDFVRAIEKIIILKQHKLAHIDDDFDKLVTKILNTPMF